MNANRSMQILLGHIISLPRMSRVLACTGLVMLCSVAQAQFTVNAFFDAPAVNPVLGCDADASIPGDQCTLRSVIQHINTLPPGNYTITMPVGYFLLSHTGHAEDAGVTGDLDVHRNIAIRGGGLGATFIDASVLGDRIFDVRAAVRLSLADLGLYSGTAVPGVVGVESGGAIRAVAGSTIELSNTEVSGCSATGGITAHGGAIDTLGDLILTNWNQFHNNRATGFGGAVHLAGTGSIVGAYFDHNRADRDGGAIRTTVASPNLRIISTRFFRNDSSAAGGAINVRGPTSVDACDFEGNTSVGVGGAINTFSTLDITSTRLFGNASQSGGGALNVAGLAVATIRDSMLEANFAHTSGGAITNSNSCTIHNSTLAGNIAHGDQLNELGGGAIYNFRNLTIINSTISHNTTPNGLGGAILNLTGGDINLVHVTLGYNTAMLPGTADTIHNGTPSGGATLRSTHTIFVNIPGSINPGVTGTSLPLISLGFNFDADGTAGFAGPGDINGTLAMPIDPLISPLGLHGGPTLTQRLMPGSPCIDAGNINFSVDPNGNTIIEDQRHHPRPWYQPDIGAFERLCIADYNNDGVVNFFDVQAFLADFASQHPRADLNLDGAHDFFDVQIFLANFSAGCP
ncbi:MAG: hypothetical protein KF757_02245 [Phycisphaeraceae bacterium]|nr:hypothetical protein [Phycisphaeraceae bacterium]MCW5762033.1 hypothetical protein [Phycisphaeraceae bacterium]